MSARTSGNGLLPRRTQLSYFLAVAEEQQMTRAARRLGVAQSALSQAIAQLESELGVALLTRAPRGVGLTRAGEAFSAKARTALAAEAEAMQTAQSLLRSADHTIAVGFIGPPPERTAPALFAALTDACPDARVSFQELTFPRGHSTTWLADVDVAFCQAPSAEPGLCVQPVRVEPRAVMARADHPLACAAELEVADVLDETFIGYHPEVQTEWAGLHSLDDHRGGPPTELTSERALTPMEMLAIMSSEQAIATVPLIDARLAQQALPDVVALRLRDARPAVLALVWHEDSRSPLLDVLVTTARDADGI
jgi:DNA-binding transcriptional LysR family regulator